jgi:hypothetical protein
LRITSTGAAMKIDEYAPIATPTNIANAKFFRVSPPNSSSDRIGSNTTSDVFTDRITVWLRDRSTTLVYPMRARSAADSVFSLTLS